MADSLHIVGGCIWTADPLRRQARSITIEDGLVAGIDGERPRSIPLFDASGCVVLPGMIDAHLHMLLGGRSLTELDLSEVCSRAQFEAAIARTHVALPPGRWLIAHGWSEERWGGSRPDKSWLALARDRPCVCYRADIHAALVNDAVLRLCAVDRPLVGGEVVRDSLTMQPTGLMIEAAAWDLVNPLVPPATDLEKRDALQRAMRHLNRLGITSATSMEYGRDAAAVYEPIRDALTVRTSIVLLDRQYPPDFTLARQFHNDERLRIIGFKAFLDGTFGSRTARMLEPYADDVGNCGTWLERAADGTLLKWARAVSEAGFQVSMHAIGDAAFRLAMDVLDAISHNGAAHRVEHAQQVADSDLSRVGGRLLSMQPLHRVDDAVAARTRLGDSRLSGFFAFRDFINAGATLAFGSDWPVVSPDPMLGVRAAVTGRVQDGNIVRADQCLSPEEALDAYTHGAAKAMRCDRVGRLVLGCHGDCVLLDCDPLTIDWQQRTPKVLATIVGGQVVYDARDMANE